MLPMSTERIEQNADFSLKLRSVGLKDLGPYSCQVRSEARYSEEIPTLMERGYPLFNVSFLSYPLE